MRATLKSLAVMTVALVSLPLAGCSGDSPGPTPPPTGATGSASSTTSVSSDARSAAQDAIAEVMGSSNDLPVAGSSTGSIEASSGRSSVTAEILQVKNTPQATQLTWRLKSAGGATADTRSFQFARPPLTDTRLLGVVDPQTKKTYHPYTYVPAQGDGSDTACVCSNLPSSVDRTGTVLYAVLPPLPAGATTVNVTLPGFPAVTGVRVTS